MRIRMTVAAALALAAYSMTPAHANDSTYEGGCGYDAVSPLPLSFNEADGGRYTGIVYFAVALVPGSDVHVVEADVSCELRINGVTQATLGPVRVTGAGVAAGPLSYTQQDGDFVSMCDVVRYTDGTPPSEICSDTLAICDAVCMVMQETRPERQQLEAEACARLGAQAPGVPGAVDVTPEGDVYASGVWTFDCPPYGPF